MRPFARPASRLTSFIARDATSIRTPASISRWICADCRLDARTRKFIYGGLGGRSNGSRLFSTTIFRIAKREKPENSSTLPSYAERQRWQMSKDMTLFVDGILARASIAGQHINAYTGTDYSGIEVLRKNILAQEQKVKDRHDEANNAKTVHRDAYTKQASAQKEIVSLLERKSSWSPTDLERYMSLVRSEHLNDQTVQVAKDDLAAAERELEEARSLLERLERKQYHEEQIWSDTIRRNSTWLTFSLMGVNILLLLANILIFEPYRRRKIVRDMKAALDEKTLHLPAHASVAEAPKQADETSAPAPPPAARNSVPINSKPAEDPLEFLMAGDTAFGEVTLAAVDPVVMGGADGYAGAPSSSQRILEQAPATASDDRAATFTEVFYDLFSERLIQVKQVELTQVALQGVAAGVTAMGLLFVLLRPK
ncbi:sensitivity to high expression protein she9 [Elasticomyces elasticus]|nr:sensitivity to high expression protein she9 [Elasticomyces elasticus]